MGECDDPTKAIYNRCGNRTCEPPEVHPSYSCRNWTPGQPDSVEENIGANPNANHARIPGENREGECAS